MRIMTLNMRYGSGAEKLGDPGYDLPTSPGKLQAIAAAIQSVEPDIVALQEVRNQLQAENLARLAGLNSVYVSHPLGYRLLFFEWGLAFLYRVDLAETASRSVLIDRTSGVGRTGLICRVSFGVEMATFINVHLDHDHKETQIENILRLLKQWPTPLCLLGDFNLAPDDSLLNPLQEFVADSCLLADSSLSREAVAAGTLLNKVSRRDYIWVDRNKFNVQEAGLLAEPYRMISDHVGYWADIDLK
ncbi:MAG: endonuclease/exonuclease/phosphatase family protein [Desulfofustis sp.]|nr:endonuclease/exonuclease/phosphatase family protein [Desulfofustis sp.]